MISDSNAGSVLSTIGLAKEKSLHLMAHPVLCLDEHDLVVKLKSNSATDVPLITQSQSLAYILYTSGTTGDPKGVTITHESIANLVDDIRQSEEITPDDRVLLFAPFSFDASVRDICGALLMGATLYVPQVEEILPGNLIRTISEPEITNCVITPSVLRSCDYEPLLLLKTIVLAGEAANHALVTIWGSGRKLINAYGRTEATVCSTKKVYLDCQICHESRSSIGTPILNTVVSIVDENDAPVASTQVGEICITGPGVSRFGYLDKPQLNAACFKDLPNGSRPYRTGDMGRIMANGEIEYLGRKALDRQFKLHGQRVELAEIENVLRSDMEIADAAVVVRGEEPTRALCAFVVPKRVPVPSTDTLASRLDILLRNNLPLYAILGSITVVDAFPLSAGNKLDIQKLMACSSQRTKGASPLSVVPQDP